MSKKSIKQLLKEQENDVREFVECNPTDVSLWPNPFEMFMENLCDGKVKYESKREAFKTITEIMYESAGGAVTLKPYRCKRCKSWHLTSRI